MSHLPVWQIKFANCSRKCAVQRTVCKCVCHRRVATALQPPQPPPPFIPIPFQAQYVEGKAKGLPGRVSRGYYGIVMGVTGSKFGREFSHDPSLLANYVCMAFKMHPMLQALQLLAWRASLPPPLLAASGAGGIRCIMSLRGAGDGGRGTRQSCRCLHKNALGLFKKAIAAMPNDLPHKSLECPDTSNNTLFTMRLVDLIQEVA
eukprot:1159136-Pelagomonas_calceolata.AAC.4